VQCLDVAIALVSLLGNLGDGSYSEMLVVGQFEIGIVRINR